MGDKKKSIRISNELLDILDELRIVIGKQTSEGFAESLSYYQLSDIFAKKFRLKKMTFDFP